MAADLAAAAVRIPHPPFAAVNVLLEHEHMTSPRGDHSGRRQRPREGQPMGREVEARDDPPEEFKRQGAAAETVRTPRRPGADHLGMRKGRERAKARREKRGADHDIPRCCLVVAADAAAALEVGDAAFVLFEHLIAQLQIARGIVAGIAALGAVA